MSDNVKISEKLFQLEQKKEVLLSKEQTLKRVLDRIVLNLDGLNREIEKAAFLQAVAEGLYVKVVCPHCEGTGMCESEARPRWTYSSEEKGIREGLDCGECIGHGFLFFRKFEEKRVYNKIIVSSDDLGF